MKLFIIGIDGLEPSHVSKIIENGESRGFVQFYEQGKVIPLRSTFPPDTILAWPTIYTGLIPQRFGLKPEPESPYEMKIRSLIIREKIKGKTFWDIASVHGKKVCIINPIFGYPPWEVNGIMISGPSFGVEGLTKSFPHINGIEKYKLGTYGKIPLFFHEYREMYDEAIDQLLDVFTLVNYIVSKEPFDLVFMADYTLDRIQHYLRRFNDDADPSKPLMLNPYRDYIENYYKIIDRLIAYIIDKYNDEYTIVVLGDHGHGRRPCKLLSLEKLFENLRGRCRFKVGSILEDLLYLYAYYMRVDAYFYKIVRFLQNKGKVKRLLLKKSSKRLFDVIETVKEFGLKEYVGIKVNSETRKINTLNIIMRILNNINVIDFAIRPEDFYEVYDVEFEADLYIKLNGFGNYPKKDSFLIIPNYTKNIISGGHSLYTSLMILPANNERPSAIEIKTTEARVQDIAPTLLELLGLREVSYLAQLDGRSVVKYG